MAIERTRLGRSKDIRVLCFTCQELNRWGDRHYLELGRYPSNQEGSCASAELTATEHQLHNPDHMIVIALGLIGLLDG